MQNASKLTSYIKYAPYNWIYHFYNKIKPTNRNNKNTPQPNTVKRSPHANDPQYY